MESEKELHLTNEIRQLKKRIKETEELFGQMDEQNQIRMKELMSQKQSLTAKNTALESRLLTLGEENAELAEIVENLQKLANAPPKPVESQPNFMSDSFVDEYTELEDKLDRLNGDKVTLQSKIRELENDIGNLVERMENLETTNAELTEALSAVNKEKKHLSQENKRLVETVNFLQVQLDTMSTPRIDQREHDNSLFGEVAAEREMLLQKKAEKEQEVAVLRKTLSSLGESERRKAMEMELMRDSMKTLSERNKHLQHELERKMDVEAEAIAFKQVASKIEQENEFLKNENARLKKQFVNAESRADENAHLLSKATISRSEFNKGVQNRAESYNVHSTPRPILRERTPSLSRNESIEPRARNIERKPSFRSASTAPMARIQSPPKESQPSRKRGIMLDFSEPANQRKLEFKVQKLSEDNRTRQLDHLRSHYDPSTGSYDQSHDESPKSAAKKGTPKKENRVLKAILRK